MIELTDEARRCLDEYLAEVRTNLRHCPSIDIADVERDVMEHIEHALAGASTSVDSPELRDVLRRLGSPSQWIPQEDLNGLQRALLALRSGPEDLRLSYLAFGLLAGTLLAAACLNLALGPAATLPFLLLGVAASFLFSRAALSVASAPGPVERWLLYPSLLLVYIPLALLILSWPLAAAVLAEALLTRPAAAPSEIRIWFRSYPMGTISAVVFLTLNSLWWAGLSFVAWRWPMAVRACSAPFADGFRPGRRLLVFGVVCLAAALVIIAVVTSRFSCIG